MQAPHPGMAPSPAQMASRPPGMAPPGPPPMGMPPRGPPFGAMGKCLFLFFCTIVVKSTHNDDSLSYLE